MMDVHWYIGRFKNVQSWDKAVHSEENIDFFPFFSFIWFFFYFSFFSMNAFDTVLQSGGSILPWNFR